MCFLSVVIPVYNVEKYLRRCIDSIICQFTDECEVILVNDGSTDSSSKICDEYAAENDFITVIHRANGGLSAARNTGITNANGKYILFLDSDDYLSEDAIKSILRILSKNECDVLVGTAYKIFENGSVKEYAVHHKIEEGLYTGKDYLEALKNNSDYSACAWLNICSKEFLINNNLFFYEGIIHEDELWTPQILLSARNVLYVNNHFYNYYIRNGSIMNSSNNKKSSECIYFVCKELLNILKKNSDRDISVLKNEVAVIFLQAVVKDRHTPKEFKRSMPIKNAYFIKTKFKSMLYFISPSLYLFVHRLVKKN